MFPAVYTLEYLGIGFEELRQGRVVLPEVLFDWDAKWDCEQFYVFLTAYFLFLSCSNVVFITRSLAAHQTVTVTVGWWLGFGVCGTSFYRATYLICAVVMHFSIILRNESFLLLMICGGHFSRRFLYVCMCVCFLDWFQPVPLGSTTSFSRLISLYQNFSIQHCFVHSLTVFSPHARCYFPFFWLNLKWWMNMTRKAFLSMLYTRAWNRRSFMLTEQVWVIFAVYTLIYSTINHYNTSF